MTSQPATKEQSKTSVPRWLVYALVILLNVVAAGLFFGEGDPLRAAEYSLSNPSYIPMVLAGGLGAFLICVLVGSVVEIIIAAIKKRPKRFKGCMLWGSVLLWTLIVIALREDTTSRAATPAAQKTSNVVSPASYIKSNGYDSQAIGDDGKTTFFTKRVVVSEQEVSKLENEVAQFSKDERVLNVCQFLSGAMKAKLIEQHGVELDTALVNYGHSDSVIACSHKLMVGAKTGSMVVFYEAIGEKMYSLYFSEQAVH